MQDILDVGITVRAEGVKFSSTEDADMRLIVSKVAAFLAGFLTPDELNLVARLSVWHSFAADLVGAHTTMLGDLQHLSVLRLVGERDSMHLLVRQAAQQRLEQNPSLQRQAQREMVEQFAALGQRMAGQQAAAARERLLAERPNVQAVCSVAHKIVGYPRHRLLLVCTRCFMVSDNPISELDSLGWALTRSGLYEESESVFRVVSHVKRNYNKRILLTVVADCNA